jgi:hypothetical protein
MVLTVLLKKRDKLLNKYQLPDLPEEDRTGAEQEQL